MKHAVLATVLAALAVPASAHEMKSLPDASTLGKGIIKISPPVPQMGEHWADPNVLPLGPLYGVKDGKIVFAEFMISKEDFEKGKSWSNLMIGREDLPSVNHVAVEYLPNGHEGYEVPHYDIHLYFVDYETRQQWK
jgi:hypothetical protein